ncbi:MAG: phosphoenolpyruvate carboxylase [Cyclobacteriaceae bacterium]
MITTYEAAVGLRYHIYNSLFLNLPYRNILRTGTLLPLLQQACASGFDRGISPSEILARFFSDFAPQASDVERIDMLFSFIQYVERQVALFDSIEDAAFEQINDLNGRGTVHALLLRTKLERKEPELLAKLQRWGMRVVLTAHPTQFYPGPVLGILTDLETAIRQHDVGQLNQLLQQLGKTPFLNKSKPTPYDEAVSLCWYLENVFYTAVPAILMQLAKELNVPVNEWPNPQLITIGFWPGGDRDGNPFVTADITQKVAARLHETLLRCYLRDIRQLRRRLTFRGVDHVIAEIEQQVSDALAQRKSLELDVLQASLQHARHVLLNEHDGLFLPLLDAFLMKVNVFGRHFACLDVRQDSRKHDAVWRVLLDTLHDQNKSLCWSDFQALDLQEQIRALLEMRFNPVFLTFTDELTNETLRTLRAIDQIQKTNGVPGCHRYIISNCQHALHVIEVFKLAQLVMAPNGSLPLDIVPLFETVEDLANASAVMEQLFGIAEYRAHLEQRGNRQTIMLGFSDGTKDGGYLRANWSIFRAKEELTRVARTNGVTVLFFDGRGGPPARGGGNTHDFYASLGESIENEEVQVTIQGQTISSNFGKVASCQFNLEQLLSAGVEAAVFPPQTQIFTEDQKKLLDQLADAGYEAYLQLKHHPQFVPYLEKVTPLSFFGDTNIGSRPVKRSNTDGLKLEDLRAIPFVGSWAMMKQNIPGFYGVGAALQKLQQQGLGPQLQALYTHNLFFRTLLGNSMMALTKTYYPATAYLREDPEFGAFWSKMHREYELARSFVLSVSGLPELMGNNPLIKESVRLREKIVLPLIAIQQYALLKLRNAQEADLNYELRYRKLVIRCMFGIINAARNSA